MFDFKHSIAKQSAMKKTFSVLFFALIVQGAESQSKNFDVIFLIDDKIDLFFASPKLITTSINNVKNEISATYYPGNLILKSRDFESLFSVSIKSIYIEFPHYTYVKEKQIVDYYKIELKQKWLSENYLIFKIYNLNRGIYKGRYEPLEANLTYTYELDSPGFTFRRVRKH
jgi:hypothetical protein